MMVHCIVGMALCVLEEGNSISIELGTGIFWKQVIDYPT